MIDSKVKSAQAGFTSCMEAGKVGCNNQTKAQIQTTMDSIAKAFATLDSTCSGMCISHHTTTMKLFIYYTRSIFQRAQNNNNTEYTQHDYL